MNSANDLEVSRGLALLGRLQRALEDFGAEESGLHREFRDRRYRIRRDTESKLAAVDAESAAQRTNAIAECDAETQRIRDRHEARRRRIQTLYRDAIRDLPRLAREQRERWLGELQMKEFLVTQRLEGQRREAEAKFERFTETLGRQSTILRRQEQRAREYFLGYLSLLGRLRHRSPGEIPPGRPEELRTRLEARLDQLQRELKEFRQLALSRVFSFLPLPAVVVLIGAIAFLLARMNPSVEAAVMTTAGVFLLAILALHTVGKRQARKPADAVISSLAEARSLQEAALDAARKEYEQKLAELRGKQNDTVEAVTGEWNRSGEIEIDFEARVRARFELRLPRALARNDRIRDRRQDRTDSEHQRRMVAIEDHAARRRNELQSVHARADGELTKEQNDRQTALGERWKATVDPIYTEVAAMNEVARQAYPAWTPEVVANWQPAREFLPVAKFGRIDVTPPAQLGENTRLALPSPGGLSIPLALTFPAHGSLLFESTVPGGGAAISCLNHLVLQLLATTPPGKLSFTIFDPVGLGENFAGLMHLGDFDESLISRRIWTQPDHLEERLADLSQHIEKVIQMYLRNEYATIVEYNAQAGSTAEKFHFLVIADFPANFSETALKRLQSILASGPRCGVYAFIHWDARQPLPAGISAEDLRKNAVCVQTSPEGSSLEATTVGLDARLVLDPAPDAALTLELTQRIGERSIDAGEVRVPFAAIAPEPSEYWKGQTAQELRVAIGRTGATKRQMFAVGRGTRQHALIAGKTGSGKSTLFHVLITNLALSFSPAEVEFYLIDFKKGVEFKCYATKQLPHARVVAIESDREFGLSVLQRVDAELRRRGEVFRRLGVQDLAGYQRSGATEPMPRSLLLIDEFQEFFVDDDAIAQGASLLLDRIVRQGRAFGIHVVLGSQTLGGAYSLARATLGQMAIRVALQCNEADAHLIMDDGNDAPRLLSRPGEGIYNDSAGAVEGNSPFQVVWLPEEERDARLDEIRALAQRNPAFDAVPVVFEGNAPADVAANPLLTAARRSAPLRVPATARAWLGAPNSIKGPTEVTFARQSGSHLLVVGQRDEASLTLLGLTLLSLAAQYPAGGARFVFLHSIPSGTEDAEFLEKLAAASAQEITFASGPDAIEAVREVAEELRPRTEDNAPGVETFVFIHGLHRFKKLRPADEFDFSADSPTRPDAQLAEILTEGAAHGMHLIVTVDTFSNVNRFLNRKALAEFEMRVAFQMSGNDSAALVDSPAASSLGLHRALLYNERDGTLETFRPYARPEPGWWRSSAVPTAATSPV